MIDVEKKTREAVLLLCMKMMEPADRILYLQAFVQKFGPISTDIAEKILEIMDERNGKR